MKNLGMFFSCRKGQQARAVLLRLLSAIFAAVRRNY